MGMKLAQATASASSLVALMPGAPESWPPERTFPLGPWRATCMSPNVALPQECLQGLEEGLEPGACRVPLGRTARTWRWR